MKNLEKSVFMIKPEATPYKEEIMNMIEKAKIPIKEWRNLTLDEHHLSSLYPTLTGEKLHKTKNYLLGKEVLAAIVEGDDVVEKLYQTCGDNVKTFLCKPDSIRYLFKDITPSDESFTKNIIHRPRNKEEAEKHIMIFFPPEKN